MPSTQGTAAHRGARNEPCSEVQGKGWRAAIFPLQDLHQGALNLPFKQDVIIYSLSMETVSGLLWGMTPLSSLADRLVCQLQAPDSSGASRSPWDLVSPDLHLPCTQWGNPAAPPCSPMCLAVNRLLQPVQEVSKPSKFPPEYGAAMQRMTAFLLQNTVYQNKGISEKMKQRNNFSSSTAECLSSTEAS